MVRRIGVIEPLETGYGQTQKSPLESGFSSLGQSTQETAFSKDLTNLHRAVELENQELRDHIGILEARVKELQRQLSVADALVEHLRHQRSRRETEKRVDSLTKVLDRTGFLHKVDDLRRIIAEQARSRKDLTDSNVVMIIDIDNFKKINDSYGHDIGDMALKHLVAKLKSIFGPPEVIGRWGGEEFVVFFPSAKLPDVHRRLIADEMGFAKISISFKPQKLNTTISFTVSGGLASVERKDRIEDRITSADEMLYKAKREGKNQILEVVR